MDPRNQHQSASITPLVSNCRAHITSLKMNLMVATIIVVVTMCNAEPPRFRHFQRQAVQPSSPEAAGAPYPPSGYRPAGAPFTLPPDTQPQTTTTEMPETTTPEQEQATTTLEPEAEAIREDKEQKRPVFLIVPRAQQVRSQSYVSYVQEYPEVAPAEEEVLFDRNPAVYSSKLQAVPVANFYNPYAYLQIYQ